MAKVLYLDTETTGVSPELNHQIIQVAGIIEIDGKPEKEFNLECGVFPDTAINDRALEVCGVTRNELDARRDPKSMYAELLGIFNEYIDKYNPADKFVLAGQNVFFDRGMVFSLGRRCGDQYVGSYFHGATIDLLSLVAIEYINGVSFGVGRKPLFKLNTICQTLGVELTDAHDALADIRATRNCILKVLDKWYAREDLNPIKEKGDFWKNDKKTEIPKTTNDSNNSDITEQRECSENDKENS